MDKAALKDIITLADDAEERLAVVRDVQERIKLFEQDCRTQQEEITRNASILQAELHRAEGNYCQSTVAQGKVLDQVPLRYRQSVEQAAVAVRAHDADVNRARRDYEAANGALVKRQGDTVPVLGKEEHRALLDQVTRAQMSFNAVTTKHEELVEEQRRTEIFLASEVAKIRKSAR